MSTSQSPPRVLQAQANTIALMIKRAERGEFVAPQFAAKIAAARAQPNFIVGIVMDDKIVTLTLPWTTIRATTQDGLAEYILNQMREARHAVH